MYISEEVKRIADKYINRDGTPVRPRRQTHDEGHLSDAIAYGMMLYQPAELFPSPRVRSLSEFARLPDERDDTGRLQRAADAALNRVPALSGKRRLPL